MPGMNGLDALKKVKELSDVEVVMVTADKTVKTAIQAVKLGAYDYISKPFNVDDRCRWTSKARKNTTSPGR